MEKVVCAIVPGCGETEGNEKSYKKGFCVL
jgi:hypothetical protein